MDEDPGRFYTDKHMFRS